MQFQESQYWLSFLSIGNQSVDFTRLFLSEPVVQAAAIYTTTQTTR